MPIRLQQVGCKATIITCGETIIKLPKEQGYRYVHGKAEARHIVAVMKKNLLFIGKNDATDKSSAGVSEKIKNRSPMTTKKHYHQNTQLPPPKNNRNDMPVLPHTKKLGKPEKFRGFFINDSGTEDPGRNLIFGQQTLPEMLEARLHLWLSDETSELCPTISIQLFTIPISIYGYNASCIYALLPNKSKTIEHKLMPVKEKNRNSSPTTVSVDLEKAVKNAIQKNF